MKSRIYIILGAGSGLGYQVSETLTKTSNIIGTYNSFKKNNSKNIKFVKLDISKNKDIENFFKNHKRILSKYKEIILISFITLADTKIIINNDIKTIKKIINLNISSVYYFTSKLIKNFLGKKLSIILTSSSRAITGDKGISLYSISKNSMHSFVKSIAIEYGGLNVRANVISLGFFKTKLWDDLNLNLKKELINKTSVKRMGNIRELNSTIKYIIQCDYLNGGVIYLDGGYGLS